MPRTLTVDRPFHLRRGSRSRKEFRQGEAAPSPPPGRVPRVSRLMALAIRLEGVLQLPAVGGTRRSASPKGSNMTAQGNALGRERRRNHSPERAQ